MNVDIDNMTIGQWKSIASLFSSKEATAQHPWVIGENYFIRTVTMAQTGRLVAVHVQELVLEDAAWIADTGRFAQAIATGDFSEIEPFPDGRRVIIGRGAIIDAVNINTPPRSQK